MTKIIAVVAANGRTGRVFVDAALKKGFLVRAGYHGENSLPQHKNLTAVRCDATKQSDVHQLLSGADAVVSLIGHVSRSPARVQTDSMKTIIGVMKELGVRRIISLTGTGVRFPNDTPNLMDKLLNASIRLIDPKRISDGQTHAEVLKATNLDWTIVRVLKLTNGKHTGRVKFSMTGPAELLTPRQRVASGILQIIDDDSYRQRAPIIQGEA